MASEAKKPLKLFYCYARRDKSFRDQLDMHLSGLKQQQMIVSWSDRKISSSVEWQKEIDTNLNNADLILLLVSPDFLASEYCYSIEMQLALKRHKAGDARVIPIIIRPVHWQYEPLSKLQVLPTNAKPASRWLNRDEAWFDVTAGIRVVVKELQALKELKEGITLLNQSRYEEALTNFTRAIDFDSKCEWAFSCRGEVYRLMGCYEEALADLTRAIDLNDKDDWWWYNRALIYLFTSDIYHFMLDIQHAIVLNESQQEDRANSESQQKSRANSENQQKSRDDILAFNAAFYQLVCGHFHKAEEQYADLISTCSYVYPLQEAADDLTDFVTLQPKHELARNILSRLQERIDEFRQASNA